MTILDYQYGRKKYKSEAIEVLVSVNGEVIKAMYPSVVPKQLSTIVGINRYPLFYEDGTPILAEYRRMSGKSSVLAHGQIFYDKECQCVLDMFYNEKSKGERRLFRFVRVVGTRRIDGTVLLPI